MKINLDPKELDTSWWCWVFANLVSKWAATLHCLYPAIYRETVATADLFYCQKICATSPRVEKRFASKPHDCSWFWTGKEKRPPPLNLGIGSVENKNWKRDLKKKLMALLKKKEGDFGICCMDTMGTNKSGT